MKNEFNFEEITLRELGSKLPIFPKDLINPKTQKPVECAEFSFIEWDMSIEEKISDIRDKSKNTGKFITKMMSVLLDQFCGMDFQEMDAGTKELLLSRTYFPNLMYMYIYLRVDQIDEKVEYGNFKCPYCNQDLKKFEANLNDLTVQVKDKEEDYITDYELCKPLIINKKTVTNFKFDISRWEALELIPADKQSNAAVLKKHLLISSLSSICDANGPITDVFIEKKTLLEKLKKKDIQRSLEHSAKNNGGPQMFLEVDCPFCSGTIQKIIDWRYDSFFENSSL
jgi:hypothetical protein